MKKQHSPDRKHSRKTKNYISVGEKVSQLTSDPREVGGTERSAQVCGASEGPQVLEIVPTPSKTCLGQHSVACLLDSSQI